MSTYESAYKSLLQGVSQQLPSERLPGQVTAQVNMTSDAVTNIRRRPGVVYNASWNWEDSDAEHALGWFTDVAGVRVHIILNTNTGNIRILNENFVEEANLDTNGYLVNADPTRIRATSVGNEFYLCNVDALPELKYNNDTPDPANSGFFYIVSGAFGKRYSVEFISSYGRLTAEYTTPSGASTGDAAKSTPEYIATQLFDQLSGLSFSDVRITSFAWKWASEPVPGKLAPVMQEFNIQENTGTALTPVWTDRTAPFEITASKLSQGGLRVRYKANADAVFTIGFQVKVSGTWLPDTFVTSAINLPSVRTGYGALITAQVLTPTISITAFTSQVELKGDPTLLIQRDGPYVFISRAGGVTVSTSVGTAYMIASKSGEVTNTGQLPARLPSAADGWICRVGTGGSAQYYRYKHITTEWLEVGAWGSPTGIANAPISIHWDGAAWNLNMQEFVGRGAGDDKANPAHEWMQYGISGIGTYQGRLVILSGPMVSLSASNSARTFFRSTVTGVISSDPIEVGSSMNSSAAYEWTVPFQKDLILMSRAYQAVIPSGNTAITPATATVVPTSGHEVDTTSGPIVLGRTLMYCTPRSEDFFGVMEMIPSNYTDSQYVSQDSTPHLPRYMPGRCRFAVSSSVASMAVFAPSGDPQSLVVHEYHWDGDTKVQQAWHQWMFPYPVAFAYFASDKIVLAFIKNSRIVLGTLDPRAGTVNSQSERRPFLDLNVSAPINSRVVQIPNWMLSFDPGITTRLKLVALTGPLAGELVGYDVGPDDTLITVMSHSSGTVGIGLPFYSSVIPTPPVATDYNGQVIHSGKATLLRYLVGTEKSSEFNVRIRDAYSGYDAFGAPTLSWSSPELELGRGLYADSAVSVVPCRTDMRSTSMELYTTGTGELNVTSLEYVARFHPKIKRK